MNFLRDIDEVYIPAIKLGKIQASKNFNPEETKYEVMNGRLLRRHLECSFIIGNSIISISYDSSWFFKYCYRVYNCCDYLCLPRVCLSFNRVLFIINIELNIQVDYIINRWFNTLNSTDRIPSTIERLIYREGFSVCFLSWFLDNLCHCFKISQTKKPMLSAEKNISFDELVTRCFRRNKRIIVAPPYNNANRGAESQWRQKPRQFLPSGHCI